MQTPSLELETKELSSRTDPIVF